MKGCTGRGVVNRRWCGNVPPYRDVWNAWARGRVRAVIRAERSEAGGYQLPAARRTVAAEAVAWFGRSAGHRRDTFFNVHGAFHRDVECKEVFRVSWRRRLTPASRNRATAAGQLVGGSARGPAGTCGDRPAVDRSRHPAAITET